jgi:EAL domain-containing protein (putative c-di-GMP-specific phosphodiesterase class I)
VSPAEFLPLVEETGLIVSIGAWMLEHACRQLSEWQRIQRSMSDFAELSLAVNLSARQLHDAEIIGLITGAATRTGISPDDIYLEVTESVFREAIEYFEDSWAPLESVGVRWSIDNFGTGYSLHRELERFPVDAIKVDRVFIERLGDSDYSAIVGAIIVMAGALGIGVTGVGVETRDQLVRLRSLRCGRAQGFFLAPPMPPEAISELVRDSHRWPLD